MVCSNKSKHYNLVADVRLLSEYRKSYYCCVFVRRNLTEFTTSILSTKLQEIFTCFLCFKLNAACCNRRY